ncbi:amidohydrolase [Gimibacter soli]|uniref:Amidohydrolase n=1 Tax=Gimibacter soli TaxID=3024400 RepID=A0AAF0BJB1_9PROT|nr:amidohydrolase [Gimibacter soli]WCL52919.1 amidohydrolase [Gimibacter soli]
MRGRRWLKGLILTTATATAIATAACFWLQPPVAPCEMLFTGGTIHTMASAGEAEALLVRDGAIVAVGALADVEAKASADVQRIDLEGRTLLPGLIEPHTHPLATALLGAAIDVSGFHHRSRAEVMAALADSLDGWQPTAWSIAFGWDPLLIDDLTPPTLAELDALSPDRPLVVLTQMMHDAYANSAALRAAGISAETPDPANGEIGRDSEGRPNGALRELGALDLIFKAIPPPPEGSGDLLLNLAFGRYAKAGYTTLGVLGPVGRDADPLALLRRRLQAEGAPVQAVIYALPGQIGPNDKPDAPGTPAAVIGVKFWMDGSPFTGGAAFGEPYENSELSKDRLHLEPMHMGALNMSADEFAAAFSTYARRGYRIAVHTQGERAIDRVLDIAEEEFAKHPRPDHGTRLEHDALITAAQLQRARALGFTTSFFIDHIYFYGHQLPDLVGADRTDRYMPLRTAVDAGHHVSLHGDHPATPIDPMRSFATAVFRKTRHDGTVIGEGQRLSRMEALRAMTIEPAIQLGVASSRGSLEPGKAADLVLISADPLTADEAAIRDIKVLGTWIAGQPVDARQTTWTNLKLLWTMLAG